MKAGRGSKAITIMGRRWTPIGPTSVLHDAKTASLARELGFMDEPLPGEDESTFLARIASRINESGRIVDLLGFVLLPEEKSMSDWTPDLAAETSAFLGSVSEPSEKKKVLPVLRDAVVHFFLIGRQSLESFRSFSSTAKPDMRPLLSLLQQAKGTANGAA